MESSAKYSVLKHKVMKMEFNSASHGEGPGTHGTENSICATGAASLSWEPRKIRSSHQSHMIFGPHNLHPTPHWSDPTGNIYFCAEHYISGVTLSKWDIFRGS